MSSSTKRNVRYKCPYCDKRFTREKLVYHVDNDHEDMIPEGYSALRVVFNYVNKKPIEYNGKCTECGGPTLWDENKGRYNRQCNKPSCKASFIKNFEENMIRTKGVTRISSTAEGLEKMLANRKISGKYKFQNGVEKTYTGSYELKALKFMDKVMDIDPDDIMCPGPVLEYEYEGKRHLYITDFYYQPYNLIIEVKDGGSRPNNRNMPEYRGKQIAKEKFIINNTNYNYLRLTDNDLSQLLNAFADLKMQLVENTGERVIHVNEACSVYHRKLGKRDISSVYFVYSKNGAANCCVSIKGFKYPFRARSTMIILKPNKSSWQIFCKYKNDEYLLPGGGWDPNEDPKDAAIREAQEEVRMNVKNVEYCGDLTEYDSKDAEPWVKENVPKDKWWYGYYSKIYVGLYKSNYTGKIEKIDKDPEMISGQWYNYDDIKDELNEEYSKAIDKYIRNYANNITTESSTDVSNESLIDDNSFYEAMNALLTGYIPGMKDSGSVYIVNYMKNNKFSGETERGYAISDNCKLTNLICRNRIGVLDKAPDDFLENSTYDVYLTDKSMEEVSELLSPYMGKFVEEEFIYEILFGKKMYDYDQIQTESNVFACIDFYKGLDLLEEATRNLILGKNDNSKIFIQEENLINYYLSIKNGHYIAESVEFPELRLESEHVLDKNSIVSNFLRSLSIMEVLL